MINRTDKHLIIGAGFVGLGIAKALKESGIAYDQVDASDNVGGNWYHGVYQTAHIISSKKITEFPYFPMPPHYPDFPVAQQMQDYLNSFADHFNLRPNIELNRTVTYVRPVQNNLWEVTFTDGEQRLYKGVLMCNGHHWSKRFPSFKGEFLGDIIHSKDYKHPDQLRGKKVLVIGGGNSACDIAAEAARVGLKSVMSMRDTVWFIPKSFAGVPIAELVQWWMPEWFQRLIIYAIIRLTFGKHSHYGLSQPEHRIFDKHPTLNNEVPYYIKHGRITIKPEVQQLEDWKVTFVDGSCEEFDLIVCATGYHLAYPFLPALLQRVEGSVAKCYGGSFLADYKGLYYIGWGQVRGGVGSILAASAPILVRLLKLQDEINVPIGLVLKEMGQKLPQTHLVDPQQVYRTIKLTDLFFNQIIKKADRVDAQYPNFSNPTLPPLQTDSKTQSLVMY